jgi:hypothetical protein
LIGLDSQAFRQLPKGRFRFPGVRLGAFQGQAFLLYRVGLGGFLGGRTFGQVQLGHERRPLGHGFILS